MKLRALILVVLLGVTVVPAWAGDVLLPTFAWNIAGRGANRWSSEVYLSNPGPAAVQVQMTGVFYGRVKDTHPCLPPSPVVVDVPAYSTTGWVGNRIWLDLGCPDFVLAGLMLHSEGFFVVNSRMVNTFGEPSTSLSTLLNGLSQEVPGIPVEDLLQRGSTYMIPALGWEPRPCGAARFDNRLQVVNPGEQDVEIVLALDSAAGEGDLVVNGRSVRGPHVVSVKARSWAQIQVGPVPVVGGACAPAGIEDLFVTTSGPVAVYGSVVDLSTQDPRTVMPIKTR